MFGLDPFGLETWVLRGSCLLILVEAMGVKMCKKKDWTKAGPKQNLVEGGDHRRCSLAVGRMWWVMEGCMSGPGGECT